MKQIIVTIFKIPFIVFYNLWLFLTIRLDTLIGPTGSPGCPGPMGMIGIPADTMFNEWLKSHPGGSIDDFVTWFVNQLEYEQYLIRQNGVQTEYIVDHQQQGKQSD